MIPLCSKKGHLERLKRMYGYLKTFWRAAIRVRTEEPDFSELRDHEFDWCQNVYGNVNEGDTKRHSTTIGKDSNVGNVCGC
jgi:hypothetical protein